MQPSKMLSLAWLFLFFTTACTLSKPSSRDSQDNLASTFLIQKAEINQTRSNYDSKISIPVSKSYSFQVCLADREQKKTIANHSFQVTGFSPEGDVNQTLISNSEGCVIWEESISYNHLSHGHFVELKRSVTANGIQSGKQTTSFAINPWEDIAYSLMSKKVEDLITADNSKQALLGTLKESVPFPNNLWINNLRLTINQQSFVKVDGIDGLELKIDVLTQPFLVTVKSGNRRVSEAISYGDFAAEIFLIHVNFENGKEVRRYLTDPESAEVRMVNGDLIISKAQILNVKPASGQVQLGLRVKPKSNKLGLKPFEGAFLIGEFDNIKGNFFSRMSNTFQENSGNITLEDYITDKKPIKTPLSQTDVNATSDTGQAQHYQKLQIVGKITANNRYFENLNSMDRKRLIKIEFCASNNFDNKPVSGQVFHIHQIDGKEQDLRTDNNGCFNWEDTYSYYFFAQECTRIINLSVSNANLNFDQTWSMNYNPWSNNDAIAFSQMQSMDKKSKEIICAKGQSRPVYSFYYFNKNTLDYEIDDFLYLKQKKLVRFSYNTAFKRATLSGDAGYEGNIPLPSGYYLLKWAVVNNSPFIDYKKDPSALFQVSERIVFISVQGILNIDLPLETDNIKAIGNMSKLLVELYPLRQEAVLSQPQAPTVNLNSFIDKRASFETVTYGSPMVLAENSEGGSFTEEQNNGKSLIDQLATTFKLKNSEIRRDNELLSNKKYFAKNENLQLFNLNSQTDLQTIQTQMQISNSQLNEWLKTGIFSFDLKAKLCRFIFDKDLAKPAQRNQSKDKINFLINPSYSSYYLTSISTLCGRAKHEDFLHVEYRYFVRNVKKVANLQPTQEDWSVNNNFSFSHSSVGTVNVMMATDLKLLEALDKFFTMKIGASASHSWSQTESTGSGFATSVPIKVDGLHFKIRAEQVEKCALVTINPAAYLTKNSDLDLRINPAINIEERMHFFSKGYLFCEGSMHKTPVTFSEVYYIFNQKLDGTYIDHNQNDNRWLFANLRGWHSMQKFKQAIGGSLVDPKDAKVKSFTEINAQTLLQKVLSEGLPIYPGQIRRDR